MTQSLSNKGFDLDLKFGQIGESLANGIITGDVKIEVKRDKWSARNQNIAVEYMSYGKPSGIATTTADYWWFVLEGLDSSIVVKTERLRELARKFYRYKKYRKNGGDYDASKLVIIPIRELWRNA